MATLSVVATPIGNLEDITLRALRLFKEADVIYAEDTRVTAKLLARYEIKTPLKRLDAAVEAKKAYEVLDRLRSGERVALVTDAGTPGISDPGSRLVAFIRSNSKGEDIQIEAIPGPSALTAALSVAGLPADEFMFMGFLPHKKRRLTALKNIAKSTITVVLYESPHRIMKLLHELESVMPERHVVVARELTKLHEEVITGMPAELMESLEARKADRGELVVIVPGEHA